jgi:hypothetical protein
MEASVAERVVAAFGGLTKMSRATGIPITTIQGWSDRGSIPRWRRASIIAVALRDNVKLPREFIEAEAA